VVFIRWEIIWIKIMSRPFSIESWIGLEPMNVEDFLYFVILV